MLGGLCFILSSCRQQAKFDSTDYSATFKAILDTTIRLMESNPEKGLKYLDAAFKTLSHPNVNDRFRYFGVHCLYYGMVKHQSGPTLFYATKMQEVIIKNGGEKSYPTDLAEADFAIGDALFDLKKYSEAYKLFYSGYNIGKNYLNKAALGEFTYRMGMILYRQEHYTLAAKYFKESLDQTPEYQTRFKPFFRKQELLDNIALCYWHIKQYDSALVYFNQNLRFVAQYGDRFPEKHDFMEMACAVVYGNKADVLIAQGKLKPAAQLLKQSIAINGKPGYDNSDAEFSEIKLAKIYYRENKMDSLFNLLRVIKTHLQQVKNQDAEVSWNQLMSNYYMGKKDYQSTVKYLHQYSILKDSLYEKNSLLKESGINELIANSEKQQQIDTLRNNNKFQRIYLWAAILTSAMALVIVLLIYRNWKRSSKEIEVINRLNTKINSQKSSLETTLEELKNQGMEKDRILRTVAHDLRNPLGGIASMSDIMVEEDEYTDEQKELLKIIRETSNNSLVLINELLEAANVNKTDLKMQRLEINELIGNSIEMLRFKAAEKEQKIRFSPVDLPEELVVDREKIWRVISNLISNAIKFSPVGSVIRVQAVKMTDNVRISVSDNGIGIPEEIRLKVFNMFTDAQRPGTMGEKSFGLGLSICKQIIESHGGKIWFDSIESVGTTFFFTLPI